MNLLVALLFYALFSNNTKYNIYWVCTQLFMTYIHRFWRPLNLTGVSITLTAFTNCLFNGSGRRGMTAVKKKVLNAGFEYDGYKSGNKTLNNLLHVCQCVSARMIFFPDPVWWHSFALTAKHRRIVFPFKHSTVRVSIGVMLNNQTAGCLCVLAGVWQGQSQRSSSEVRSAAAAAPDEEAAASIHRSSYLCSAAAGLLVD